MGTRLITGPLEEPVTLAQAREHLKANTTAEDALILSLIVAAREQAEALTDMALLTQTWEYTLDGFWGREIVLPKPPLQSVTSVKYVDPDGTEQTFDTSKYEVDATRRPGRIRLVSTENWPVVNNQMNAVTIRFVAGYIGAGALPYSIKAAVLLYVQYMENRDANAALKTAADSLLSPYQVLLA